MAERSCRDQALLLLGQRAHFRRELARKLALRDYQPDEVSATLDRLTADGYLDDARTAVAYVAERQGKRLGRARLAAELAERGADEAAIEAALADVEPADELASALAAGERWQRSHRDRDPQKARAALGRHLAGRGFGTSMILSVLAKLASGGVEDADFS
jgi:regulatory protein